MSWQDVLKGDSLTWLIEAQTPGVRYLALRDLTGCSPDDAELSKARKLAHAKGEIATVLAKMHRQGFWVEAGPGYNPKYLSTVWAIILLAQLGAVASEDERVCQACAYLLDHALTEGGQFSTTSTASGTADCLQGNMCWAVTELGFQDRRMDGAFEWTARSVTGEGIADVTDKKAAVRYYAGKRGPTFACGANNKQPCAWGAAKVMMALGRLTANRRTAIIKRAIKSGVDFLFSVDPADATWPSGWANHPSGNWWKFGFPLFYVTDLLQVIEALVALGYGKDKRLGRAIQILLDKQDADGRWSLDYDYSGKTWVEFGPKGKPNAWVTLRALRVLKAVDEA